MPGLFEEKYVKREYECTGSVEQVEIVSASDAIYVTSGDVTRVTLSYWECPGTHEYDLREADGKLVLAFRDGGNILDGMHHIFRQTPIEMILPASFAGSLDLGCASGETELNVVNADKLKIGSASGRVRVADVSCRGEVNIGTSSGAVELQNVTGADFVVSGKSGAVRMDGIRALGRIESGLVSGSVSMTNVSAAGDVSVDSRSGGIKLESVSTEASLNASTVSGSIHCASLRTGGDIGLSSTSGSVKGTIIGREGDYAVSAGTVTGSNNLNNSEGGSRSLSVNTVSGSIDIRFVAGE
ncbi:MAG: DUF4097 domain-containing protein [Lachnospiraceae bacterium]|nr:DUF4097 domain-containing protein [Lachnospiraceae bacterium]